MGKLSQPQVRRLSLFRRKRCIAKPSKSFKTQRNNRNSNSSNTQTCLRQQLSKKHIAFRNSNKQTQLSMRKNYQQRFKSQQSSSQLQLLTQQIIKWYQNIQYQLKQNFQYEKILREVLPLITNVTDKCTIICSLGLIKLLQREYDEALIRFDDVIKIDPLHQKAILSKGIIIFQTEGFDKSIQFLEKYIDVNKKDQLEILTNMIYLFNSMGLRQIPLQYLKRLELIKPNDQTVLNEIAIAYYLEENYQLAAEYFKKILQINPYNQLQTSCLSRCYFMTKQFDKSQLYFFRLLEISQNLFHPQHFDLGKEYLIISEYSRAHQIYSKIQQNYPHFKSQIFIPKYVMQYVEDYEVLILINGLKWQDERQKKQILYIQRKNLLLIVDRFPTLFQITDRVVDIGKKLNLDIENPNESFKSITIGGKKKGKKGILTQKQIKKSYENLQLESQKIQILLRKSEKQILESFLYTFQQQVDEIHHTCLALSQIKLAFSFNSSMYKGKYIEGIDKYLKYCKKIINFVKNEKEDAKIQVHLKKILTFSQLTLEKIQLPIKSIYLEVLQDNNAQINYSKMSKVILSLTSKEQKQMFVQKFAFESFLKVWLLKFIYNQIAFFFTFERSIQLSSLLKQIKQEPQFQLKDIKQHLLRIIQRDNDINLQKNLYSAIIDKFDSEQKTNISQDNCESKMSSQLSDTHEVDITLHLCKITQQKLKFYNIGEKFNVLRKLVMKNICLNYVYLSSQTNKNKFIVQCLEAKDWKEEYFEKGFYVKTKRGDNICNKDEEIIQGIWKLGRQYVFSWITSIACAIAQIEAMGLFHCDIEFRNTVRFEHIFKLIDFDYLFKVKIVGISSIQKQAYHNMLQMIREFLKIGRLQKSDSILNFLFKRVEQYDEALSSQLDYDSFLEALLSRVIRSQDQAKYLMKELESYSYELHLLQFERLVKKLLDQTKIKSFVNVMSKKQIDEIIKSLKWLCQKQITYKQFAKQVTKVKLNSDNDYKQDI